MSNASKVPQYRYSVFVKPWKALGLEAVARLVADIGFDAVELPVREGFPVNPENAMTQLPATERLFRSHGIAIASLAASPTEAIVRAAGQCSERPMIRDMAKIEAGENYLAAEAKYRRHYEALTPVLRDCGVRIGVQNHNNRFVANAAGLRSLLQGLDPECLGAVWDPAHCALAGELPDLAFDLLEDRLYMVNLKNAIWRRITGPEAEEVRWKHYWTSGRQGLCSWSSVAAELQRRDWHGTLTLCAEYADEHSVERLTREDFFLARRLFSGGS